MKLSEKQIELKENIRDHLDACVADYKFNTENKVPHTTLSADFMTNAVTAFEYMVDFLNTFDNE